MRRSIALVFDDPGDRWLDLLVSVAKTTPTALSLSLNDKAAFILRKEISSESKLRKLAQWNFTTLHDAISVISRDPRACPTPLRYGLTCFTQLAAFLVYAQDASVDLSAASSLKPLGYRIGTIAAAVVRSSRNLCEYLEAAQEAIAVAFRVGAIVERKIATLLGNYSGRACWASATLKLSHNQVQDLLPGLKLVTEIVPTRCYISTTRSNSTVISGPLDHLTTLLNGIHRDGSLVVSEELAFHAPHLFCEQDLEAVGSIDQSLKNAVHEALCVASDQRATIESLAQGLEKFVDVTILAFFPGDLAHDIHDRLSFGDGAHPETVDLIQVCSNVSQKLASKKCPIAVVGMAGRFPEADDAEQLWQLLQMGKDVHRTVPPDRFNHETHTDPSGKRKNTSKTPYGCFINAPGLFDSRFFNMSPKEAAQTDPAQRLLILTAYEALEMSGFVVNRTASSREDRVGTFYGQASDDWRETNSSQDIDTYFIPGGIRAFGPGRINYHMKFSGPSFSVDTACSSSFAALHTACNSLWAGDCDTAIAGGSNILTNPDITAGLSRGHFLSQSGSCKTFDATADGYCRADGIGTVVLKRLEDAEDDRDNIIGVIHGIGTNHSAHAVSITHPHSDTQAALYQSVLDNSGVDAHDVDYVEMHGTGTQAGDLSEMTSVSDVFAPRERPRRSRPVYVGAIKSNIGHAEAAAGVESLIKVILMMRNQLIPPHVGIKGTINPALPSDLDARNLRITQSGERWLRRTESTPRMAFLNNFSAAGGNTALLLREHIGQDVELVEDSRSKHIMTISAKTIRSMQMNLRNLACYIRANPHIRLADLSYTLTARRTAHTLRKSFVVSSLSEAAHLLQSSSSSSFEPSPTKLPGVVFTFTGQGSMYTGVARRLYESNPSFRRQILEYDGLAQAYGFPSFLELITGTTEDIPTLSPIITQVGQVSVQLALAYLWQSWGIPARAVIGHSLGEYPALVIAGVMSASDMIYLVGRRAQLLEESCDPQSHGMIAVNESSGVLAPEISGTSVEISCDNSPKMTILGGPKDTLQDYSRSLQSKGYKCVWLPVLHAYHTAQVDPILADFEAAASRIRLLKPRIPILSSVLGRIVGVGSEEITPVYLSQHSRKSVKFRQVLSSLEGLSEWTRNIIWLEIGPQPICVKLVQQTLGPQTAVATSLSKTCDSWQTLSEAVCQFHDQGFAIEWDMFHCGFEKSHQLIDLPSYAWDLKNFWIDYRYDWSLAKGDQPSQPIEESRTIQSALSTTSIQRILEEDISEGIAHILTETDFSEPLLQKKAAGHKVNGVALCPSSLYADMALTVADYLRHRLDPGGAQLAMDVCDMKVDKPYIVDQGATMAFRVKASSTTEAARLELFSVSKNDASRTTMHAKCSVKFAAAEKWRSKLQKTSYLVKERMAALERASAAGQAHRIQRNLVYRLFSNFVEYDAAYQGIEEVILDSPQFEARAKVVLKPVEKAASFHTPPTWIDSLCHLAGVILNASDAVDHKSFVYISHGWKALRILEELTEGATYETYTKMQNIENDIMEGDVWMMKGDRIVGIIKGIKFQRISRKVINVLLPSPNTQATTTPAARISAQGPSGAPVHKQPSRANESFTEQPKTLLISQKSGTSSRFDAILDVISDECGVDPSELVDGCTFTSLGIDSLLSLEILAKVRENLDVDLRPHIFLENETIGEFKNQLLDKLAGHSKGDPQESQPSYTPALVGSELTTPSQTTSDSGDDVGSVGEIRIESEHTSDLGSAAYLPVEHIGKLPGPKAVSYLLSGSPTDSKKFLFLFPDGSGSATSYATMPPLGLDVVAFGLNCPYMTTPQAWNDGIGAVTELYLEEIRRRKPTGPYSFAGWSAGGILAYHAAWVMQQRGEKVEHLILIDSPCPVGLPRMPIKMFEFLDSVGMLGNAAGTPGWVIPHFEATVGNLDGFVPSPFAAGQEPHTTLIWARYGVSRESGGRRPKREASDPAVLEWLLEDRTDFGFNGWDQLIQPCSMTAAVIDGHHFSITNEQASELSRLIADTLR